MIFGDTHLASFGRCKVVSWKNGVFADFQRKEVSYRGRVFASVEVPTVRSIEATILVREHSPQALDEILRRIGKWLYDAGEAKLFAERDLSHYYIARCVSVSTPTRNGFSARVTATFHCIDNRLYSVHDNQPITTATSEMNNFSFNGKHCLNDMGCVFVMENLDAVPKATINKYSISGRSGTLRYDSGEGTVFNEKSLSGLLYFVKDTTSGLMSDVEINERLHQVAAWLGASGRSKLVFDSDISRYYEAETQDAQVFTRKDWDNGCVKIKFVLQPYATDAESKMKTAELSLTAGVQQTVDLSDLIPEGIGHETPMLLTVENKGTNAITELAIGYWNDLDNNRSMNLSIPATGLTGGTTLIIDGKNGAIATTNGISDGISWLVSGDFPALYAGGSKKITVMSSVNASVSVGVSFNARWL